MELVKHSHFSFQPHVHPYKNHPKPFLPQECIDSWDSSHCTHGVKTKPDLNLNLEADTLQTVSQVNSENDLRRKNKDNKNNNSQPVGLYPWRIKTLFTEVA